MEQSVFKIGEVSARLGLVDKNSNTLRGWTEEFKEFLSTSANPAPGLPRRYTAHDIQVLSTVRDYRANHLSYEEIRDQLRAGVHEVSESEVAEEESAYGERPYVTDGQALVPLAQLETLLAPLAASADEWRRLAEEYRTRLEAREERIETLEQRVEELYARLDSTAHPPGKAQGANGATPPEPTAQEAPGDAAPVRHEPAQANGFGHSEPPTDTPSLFPLPTVESAAGTEDEGYAFPDEAPRRRWWRVWR